MGRKPVVPGKPRRRTITIRLTDEGLAALDKARGTLTRGDYVRAALTAYLRRTP